MQDKILINEWKTFSLLNLDFTLIYEQINGFDEL